MLLPSDRYLARAANTTTPSVRGREQKSQTSGGGLSHAEMKHGQTNRERFWRGVGAGETLIRIICIMIVLKWEAQNSRPYL